MPAGDQDRRSRIYLCLHSHFRARPFTLLSLKLMWVVTLFGARDIDIMEISQALNTWRRESAPVHRLIGG